MARRRDLSLAAVSSGRAPLGGSLPAAPLDLGFVSAPSADCVSSDGPSAVLVGRQWTVCASLSKQKAGARAVVGKMPAGRRAASRPQQPLVWRRRSRPGRPVGAHFGEPVYRAQTIGGPVDQMKRNFVAEAPGAPPLTRPTANAVAQPTPDPLEGCKFGPASGHRDGRARAPHLRPTFAPTKARQIKGGACQWVASRPNTKGAVGGRQRENEAPTVALGRTQSCKRAR